MSFVEPAPKKGQKSDKKIKLQEEDFVLSTSSFEGEILVKGKTLGRWETKKFTLDPENKILILKRKNPKKKSKVYELTKYQIENQEQKKERLTFDLEPIQSGDKKLSLGSTNLPFINPVVNTLISCCFKPTGSPIKVQPLPQNVVEKVEKQQIRVETQESEDDEYLLKHVLPDHFNNNEIINNLHDNYQDEQFEVELEQGEFRLSRNRKNPLLVKASMKFQKKIPDIVLFNLLTNPNYVSKWNKFVTSVSNVVRPLPQEKAHLIQEQRVYGGLFPFPREYYYLRHSRRQADRILVIDRLVDAIDISTKVVKGQIRFAIWRIYQTQDEIRLFVTMEATNTGLAIVEEDGYFTAQYLKQLIQLNEYINLNKEILGHDQTLLIDPFSQQMKSSMMSVPNELQKEEKQQIQQIESQQQKQQIELPQQKDQLQQIEQKQQIEQVQYIQQKEEQMEENQKDNDEFYDCDDEEQEKVNDKLHFESRKSISQEIGERHHIELKYSQPEWNEVTWTKTKMQQFNSGEYKYLNIQHKYPQEPLAKSDKYQLVQLPHGLNFLFKDDWVRDDLKGGLKMINTNKIDAQKKVLKFLLKRIGVNILTGKSIMNVSMPVDIFETRSTTERMCNALAFAPQYLEPAAKKPDPVSRMVDVLSFAIGFVVNFLSMEKPFNPILGETYQGWIEKCPVYAEQICHHPAITAFQMYGRGYKIDGRLEMVANINSNSVNGKNVGYIQVKFADQTIKVMLAPGLITGTAYGDRMFYFTGKTICTDIENQLVAEVMHQPDKKYCLQMNMKPSTLGDYLCGGIFKVTESAAPRFLKEGYKKYQGLDKSEIREVLHKIEGRWTKDIQIDSTNTILDVVNGSPSVMEHEQFPLASDANYRLDVLWWKLRDFDQAQGTKELMEVAQRVDKKLKEAKRGTKH